MAKTEDGATDSPEVTVKKPFHKFHCSFCGRPEDEVKKLVLGHRNMAICDRCLLHCIATIFNAEKEGDASDPTA